MRRVRFIVGLLQLAMVVLVTALATDTSDMVLAGPLVVPLMIASTAFSVYSAHQQGQAAKEQARTEEGIAAFNAAAAQRQADMDADRLRREGARIQAEQTAAYGKSGVLFSGSPLTVIGDTAKELEWDRQMILAGGQTESRRWSMQAQAAGQRGRAASRAGALAAVGAGFRGMTEIAKYKTS